VAETQDRERLEKALAAIVKLERQLDSAKVRLARLSGSYDLCRIAQKDQIYDPLYYAEGSRDFDPSVAPFLDQVASQLINAPKLNLRIEGHADRWESNDRAVELSKDRSRRVRDHLVSRGVRPSQIKWCGYGERMQIFDPSTDTGRALNRRVELWPLVQWFLEPEPNDPERMRNYERYVNPWLGGVLRRTGIDQTFMSGRGTRLYDDRGNEYVDFCCGCGALPFGHNPADMWQAVEEVRDRAMVQVAQPSMQHEAGELARRLVEVAPGNLDKVVFANSGTEAIEAALKLCRAKTGRPGVLTTWNGFHGKTLGSLSSSGNPAYQTGYYAPVPSFDKVPFGDARALEEVLAANPNRYAVFLVEVIQGQSGIISAPPGYLRAAREICDRHGVLLALDEVATGLGRTGDLFACEHEGIVPDVLVLGKGLSGGLIPIGAAVFGDAAWSEQFGKTHSSTYAMNSLACHVGVAALEKVCANDRALVRNAREIGARLRAGFLELKARYPKVLVDVRGRGLVIGLKFTDDREVWGAERLMGAVADYGQLAAMMMTWLQNVARVRIWITFYSSDVMRLTPPLDVQWADCERVLEAFGQVLELADSGNVAALALEPHGERLPDGYTVERAEPVPWNCPPQPGDRCFAFLLHLADLETYRDFDPTLRPLDDTLVQKLSENIRLDPTPVNYFDTRVTSITGVSAHGSFIAIPYTAEELKAMPREESMKLIRKALDLGREEDVEIVGLGGYTSILTASGLDLLDEQVPLTSGNAYTVVTSHEATCSAMDRLGRSLDTTMAIVGASGSIGSALALLLGEVAGRLILVGNAHSDPESTRRRLLEVGARVCRHVALSQRAGKLERPGSLARALGATECPAADAPIEDWLDLAQRHLEVTCDLDAALPEAAVVVTATSHPGALLPIDKLRQGALVCDVAVPSNVSKEIQTVRPDVLVIDGGIVSVPGPVRILGTKLGRGMSYACMAETMLLCLDGRPQEGTVGPSISIEKIELLRALARKHGFQLASLRSFGAPLDESEWERYQVGSVLRAVGSELVGASASVSR
jgi:acetylornithine/succinyldiaminopimelate/putrescine aminotransferase/predicted amino acid dehydrogenase/outer membrane protein OmpA-like peptidoglycan-associated protein